MAAALLYVSCSDEPDDSATRPTAEFKVIQDRVIELTYNDFGFLESAQYLSKYDPDSLKLLGGCTALVLDHKIDGKQYVARNQDYYCSYAPAVIVRNNGGTYKTIGFTCNGISFDPWTDAATYQIKSSTLKSAPYFCVDVMNEKGLYMETDIRAYEEFSKCEHTSAGKPRLCTHTFMQLMLSNYASIDSIKAHMNDYDWFDLEAMGFHEAFLCADPSGRSVVFEFANNKVQCIESDCNANYFLTPELYAQEEYGCGENRVDSLRKYMPRVKTEDDIFAMLSHSAYTQFYSVDVDPDFAIPEFYEDIGYTRSRYIADPEGARRAFKEYITTHQYATWQDRVDNYIWETTFMTAANLTDRKMHVHFSEHYGIDFTVGF